MKNLSDTANGKLSDQSKLMLETYIQTAYFDRIIRRANLRLKVMSNGQYMELVNRRKNRGAQAVKPLENLVKKREHDELQVPIEFYEEIAYMKR